MELSNITSLSVLFDEWKQAHREDPPLKNHTENFKNNSFCDDGPINSGTDKIEILFLLEESNLQQNNGAPCNKEFWFRDKVYKERKHGTKYWNALTSICDKLGSSIDSAAYMNLNKRGGLNRTIPADLKNYSKKYQAFIKKEIELLNPSFIVCCRELTYKILTSIIYNNNYYPSERHFIYQKRNKTFQSCKILYNDNYIEVFCVYHPAARVKFNEFQLIQHA